jgi:hypothetical protein
MDTYLDLVSVLLTNRLNDRLVQHPESSQKLEPAPLSSVGETIRLELHSSYSENRPINANVSLRPVFNPGA